MNKIKLSIALFFLVQFGFGQSLNQYVFSQSIGSYSVISGGTVLGNTITDDERFVDPSLPLGGSANTGVGLPIGFNFVFNGFTYDRFSINANGWIALGTSSLTPAVDMTSTSVYTPLSTLNAALPNVKVARIAAFARDLQAQAGAEIRYEVLGTAPNRTLVVQWKNYTKYLAIGDSMNFQIRLLESSNSVQISYGTMTNNATSSLIDCGLRAAPNTPATNFANRTTTTSWTASTAGATANEAMLITQTIFPPSGLNFVWTPPLNCSGTPVPGNTIVVQSSVCASNPFTLSLQNPTNGSSVTYQWMTSSDGIAYSNASGIASESTYVTSQTVPTYYKCVVTCSATGLFSESTPIQVGISPASSCYCIPTYTTGKTEGDLISSIVINGTTLSNTTGTSPTNPSYTYFIGQPNYTANLQAGGTYTVSVTVGSFGGQNISMWIDYNDNGFFETNERIGSTTTAIDANGTATFTISLACNPPLGTHRMRVRDVWNQNGNTIDPCLNYGYGEAEDYDITITTPVACPQPSNIQTTAITSTSAVISWVAGCTETAWMVYVVPAGSPPPTAGFGIVVNVNPFTIVGLTPNTSYDIYISSDCGANGSSLLTGPFNFRTLIPPPVNDNCSTATVLIVGETITSNPLTGTNVSATNSNPPAPGCANFVGGDVWYTVVVPPTGNLTLETNNAAGSLVTDTGMAVYSGNCSGLLLLACDDDSSSNGNFSLISLSGLTPGQVLYVNVWEYDNDVVGEFQIAAYDCPSGTPAPLGDSTQIFCGNDYTISSLYVEGSGIQWYASATGGLPLNDSTTLINGTTYYASQTINCESYNRFAVTVQFIPLPIVSNTLQQICETDGDGNGVFDLTESDSIICNQSGVVFSYYTDYFEAEASINAIPDPTTFSGNTGQIIYVRVENGVCFSIAELSLEVNLPSDAPVGNPIQDYCTTSTLADLTVFGTNIIWYSAAVGGTQLPINTPLVDGSTYYASQNELGCESTTRLSVTVQDVCIISGCLTATYGEFPTGLVTPNCSGVPQLITDSGWAGQYSNVSVIEGVDYTFSSSVSTDVITIGNEDGSVSYAAGNSPLVWTASQTGTVRFYTHADNTCAENQNFRARFVACGTPPPPPINDLCTAPIPLNVGGVYDDFDQDTTSLGATLSLEFPLPSCGIFNFQSVGKDVWYQFVVPSSGSATVETGGTSTGAPGIDTVVQAYTGTCGALTALDCDDDGATEVVVGHSKLQLTGLTPGQLVLLRVFGYNGAQGNFGISVYDASLATIAFAESQFVAYPNPVNDVLNISSSDPFETVQIFNCVGQELIRQPVNGNSIQINIDQLPAGTYLVRASGYGQLKTLKIIKQ